jgi:hypothetical protein
VLRLHGSETVSAMVLPLANNLNLNRGIKNHHWERHELFKNLSQKLKPLARKTADYPSKILIFP